MFPEFLHIVHRGGQLTAQFWVIRKAYFFLSSLFSFSNMIVRASFSQQLSLSSYQDVRPCPASAKGLLIAKFTVGWWKWKHSLCLNSDIGLWTCSPCLLSVFIMSCFSLFFLGTSSCFSLFFLGTSSCFSHWFPKQKPHLNLHIQKWQLCAIKLYEKLKRTI